MQDINGYERFIGLLPGCYSMGVSHPETFVAGANLVLNSAEAPLTALTVYGHSTQDGTPSPDNPVPIVSAGSVMTTGKNVLPPEPGAEVHMNIPAGTKCFLVTDGTPSNGGNILLYDAEGNVYYLAIDAGDTEDVGCSYGVTYNVDIVRFVNRLVHGVNTAMYIGEKLPYEPYTGGVPGVNPYEGEINVSVSDGGTQSQTLTLSTPGGLPGIPVTSGGNYTDADGQQWVCDEIDLARGKYVQRVGTETINGGYNLSETPDFPGRFLQHNAGFTNSYKNGGYKSVCNIALWHGWGVGKDDTAWVFAVSPPGYYLNPPTASGITTADELNAFLNSLGFPLVLAGQLETPIETDLPAEEIAAYKALHTYSPATTVSNDADAWMKVGYYGLTTIQKLEKEAIVINGGKS